MSDFSPPQPPCTALVDSGGSQDSFPAGFFQTLLHYLYFPYFQYYLSTL